MLEIMLNGERRSIPPGLNVRTLLQHLELPADRVAVELNRAIVRQHDWESAQVAAGAEIEIVQFVGGG
ncbi:MAG TPA: sulfur carrier protein ThiS [Bryobacteraceae bacterium]|nr:sulfur carrier protein ThiS [Bryobacteraceae bacterium]